MIYTVYYSYRTSEKFEHAIHFEDEVEAKKFLTMAINSPKIYAAYIHSDIVQKKYSEWMEKMINL